MGSPPAGWLFYLCGQAILRSAAAAFVPFLWLCEGGLRVGNRIGVKILGSFVVAGCLGFFAMGTWGDWAHGLGQRGTAVVNERRRETFAGRVNAGDHDVRHAQHAHGEGARDAGALATIGVLGQTWLIAGSDSRKGERARADALMLIRIHAHLPRVLVISVPRDMRVHIPGFGWTKINHALAYGDTALLRATVASALDVRIDHVVRLDFRGFVQLIDAVGGVTVLVDEPLRYDDATDGTHIALNRGWQHLNGSQALDFVRFRHDALADTGRMKRQQRLLAALTATHIPLSRWQQVIGAALKIPDDVVTDVGVWEALTTVSRFSVAKHVIVTSHTLEGTNLVDPVDGLWYFYLDPRERGSLRRQFELFDRGH